MEYVMVVVVVVVEIVVAVVVVVDNVVVVSIHGVHKERTPPRLGSTNAELFAHTFIIL